MGAGGDVMQIDRAGSLRGANARASFLAVAIGIALAPQAGAQSPAGPQLEEITVTATRRTQALSDVPISVSAIGDEELQQRGARQFDDIIRLTPGLNLTRQSFTGASQIAIRGISSNAGSGTTGIYIDDTPIQVRNMGFGAGNSFPGLFDIERIEVLRGPQGALYGGGSIGGVHRSEKHGNARGQDGNGYGLAQRLLRKRVDFNVPILRWKARRRRNA